MKMGIILLSYYSNLLTKTLVSSQLLDAAPHPTAKWLAAMDAHGFDLSTLKGDNGFYLEDCNSHPVSRAGDVNGDKIADLVVGAHSGGSICVVFGAPNIGADGHFKASNLNGTNGFIAYGGEECDSSYSVVSAAGDINHDGVDDLIVGAKRASPASRMQAGSSFVIFGSTKSKRDYVLRFNTLDGSNGFAINGVKSKDFSGHSVSGLGDVNGDKFDDLIIGAPQVSPGNRTEAGSSYVVFGHPDIGAGGALELSSLNGSNGFVINGVAAGDQSGFSVKGIGDFNGDGIADFAIGAPTTSPSKTNTTTQYFYNGSTYVIFGNRELGSDGVLELKDLNKEQGFVINGAEYDYSGSALAGNGDLNADGRLDLIIGSNHGSTWSGEVGWIRGAKAYVVFGKADIGAEGDIELSKLNGGSGFIVRRSTLDNSGGGFSSNGITGVTPVDIIGDINGDGIDDAMIGASLASPEKRTQAGSVYVIYGSPTLGANGSFALDNLNGENGFPFIGPSDYKRIGTSFSRLGDINVDGATDYAIGALTNPACVIFGGINSSAFSVTLPAPHPPVIPVYPPFPPGKESNTSLSNHSNHDDHQPEEPENLIQKIPFPLRVGMVTAIVFLFSMSLRPLLSQCLHRHNRRDDYDKQMTNAVLAKLWVGFLGTGIMSSGTYAGYQSAIADIKRKLAVRLGDRNEWERMWDLRTEEQKQYLITMIAEQTEQAVVQNRSNCFRFFRSMYQPDATPEEIGRKAEEIAEGMKVKIPQLWIQH